MLLGTATSVSIESGGTTVVEGGGNAANTTVASGGTEIVGAGGTATGIVVSSGGTLELFGGAVATGFDIEPGGNLVLGFGFPLLVSSGQVASAITVLSNTQLTVTSGGTANGTVLSGGTLVVADGALADPTLIFSGGSEVVSAGGIDEGALVSGGAQIVYGLASGVTVFTGSQLIESGGSAVGTTISNGGEVEVLLGGMAEDVSFVGSGGLLELHAPSGLSGIIDVSETGSIDFVSASVISAGISGSTLVVTEAGSETFSYQLGSLQAGTSVSLQSDGNNGTDVVLQAPVVSGTSLTITASPNSVPADGATTTTLTVTVEDAKGNLLAEHGGDAVGLRHRQQLWQHLRGDQRRGRVHHYPRLDPGPDRDHHCQRRRRAGDDVGQLRGRRAVGCDLDPGSQPRFGGGERRRRPRR